jgi:3-oxoacyl-[acyl-carrier protein] reductase
MDMELAGRIAMVGGASRGLGYAVAEALAQEGMHVAIAGRGEAALRAAAKRIAASSGVQPLAVPVDLNTARGPRAFAEACIDRFGAVDVLVTNTGGPPSGPFEALDDEDWQRAFDGLLLSAVRLSRAVLPSMRRRGGGRIVHNTSFTVKEPEPGMALSNALRAAVVALGKTQAREFAADGILVNSICPGPFATERLEELVQAAANRTGTSADEHRQGWTRRVPLGRLLDPEELAALVVFLASPRSSGITGATFPVDGGLLRGLL